MKGPGRKTVGGAYVGSPIKRGPLQRPCPKCPANAHAHCLTWMAETGRDNGKPFRGEGRWKPIRFHAVRALATKVEPCTTLPAAQCDLEGQHGYHEHTPTGSAAAAGLAWCRGKAR